MADDSQLEMGRRIFARHASFLPPLLVSRAPFPRLPLLEQIQGRWSQSRLLPDIWSAPVFTWRWLPRGPETALSKAALRYFPAAGARPEVVNQYPVVASGNLPATASKTGAVVARQLLEEQSLRLQLRDVGTVNDLPLPEAPHHGEPTANLQEPPPTPTELGRSSEAATTSVLPSSARMRPARAIVQRRPPGSHLGRGAQSRSYELGSTRGRDSAGPDEKSKGGEEPIVRAATGGPNPPGGTPPTPPVRFGADLESGGVAQPDTNKLVGPKIGASSRPGEEPALGATNLPVGSDGATKEREAVRAKEGGVLDPPPRTVHLQPLKGENLAQATGSELPVVGKAMDEGSAVQIADELKADSGLRSHAPTVATRLMSAKAEFPAELAARDKSRSVSMPSPVSDSAASASVEQLGGATQGTQASLGAVDASSEGNVRHVRVSERAEVSADEDEGAAEETIGGQPGKPMPTQMKSILSEHPSALDQSAPGIVHREVAALSSEATVGKIIDVFAPALPAAPGISGSGKEEAQTRSLLEGTPAWQPGEHPPARTNAILSEHPSASDQSPPGIVHRGIADSSPEPSVEKAIGVSVAAQAELPTGPGILAPGEGEVTTRSPLEGTPAWQPGEGLPTQTQTILSEHPSALDQSAPGIVHRKVAGSSSEAIVGKAIGVFAPAQPELPATPGIPSPGEGEVPTRSPLEGSPDREPNPRKPVRSEVVQLERALPLEQQALEIKHPNARPIVLELESQGANISVAREPSTVGGLEPRVELVNTVPPSEGYSANMHGASYPRFPENKPTLRRLQESGKPADETPVAVAREDNPSDARESVLHLSSGPYEIATAVQRSSELHALLPVSGAIIEGAGDGGASSDGSELIHHEAKGPTSDEVILSSQATTVSRVADLASDAVESEAQSVGARTLAEPVSPQRLADAAPPGQAVGTPVHISRYPSNEPSRTDLHSGGPNPRSFDVPDTSSYTALRPQDARALPEPVALQHLAEAAPPGQGHTTTVRFSTERGEADTSVRATPVMTRESGHPGEKFGLAEAPAELPGHGIQREVSTVVHRVGGVESTVSAPSGAEAERIGRENRPSDASALTVIARSPSRRDGSTQPRANGAMPAAFPGMTHLNQSRQKPGPTGNASLDIGRGLPHGLAYRFPADSIPAATPAPPAGVIAAPAQSAALPGAVPARVNSGEASRLSDLEIKQLADKVYGLLVRRLASERDRRGIGDVV